MQGIALKFPLKLQWILRFIFDTKISAQFDVNSNDGDKAALTIQLLFNILLKTGTKNNMRIKKRKKK